MVTSATLLIEAMASPTPKRPAQSKQQIDPFARYPPRPPRTGPPELVDPRFLLKAFVAAVVAAVLLAYVSVCVLVYIGGWHRLLHPSPVVGALPAGITVEQVSFDAAATGKPRLTGWWIPSDSASAPTILYLHDGDGALAYTGNLPLLHTAGVNIFAIDYRGYGKSDPPHPTQTRMQEDSAVALDYLLYTRHIAPGKIVPYGVGLGGVLAANLAAAHPELPAVVVDQPKPNAYYQAVDAQQSRLLPMHLLVRDHFDIAAALGETHQPKLLFTNSPDAFDPKGVAVNALLFRNIASPKTTVTFDRVPAQAAYLESLRRFLDEAVK